MGKRMSRRRRMHTSQAMNRIHRRRIDDRAKKVHRKDSYNTNLGIYISIMAFVYSTAPITKQLFDPSICVLGRLGYFSLIIFAALLIFSLFNRTMRKSVC